MLNEGKKQSDETGDALASCLFAQYRFCVAAGLLGGAYGLKYKKGAMPLFLAGTAGTAVDFAYGYAFACSKERDVHNEEKEKERKAKLHYDVRPE